MNNALSVKDRISVIIPCYNHGRFIPTAINSILKQQYPDTEITVVDDGSVDNTREQVAGFPGVKYVYQQNQGLSAARNTGIALSSGEFLVFLDADDWLKDDAFQKNISVLKSAPEAAFVSGGHIKIAPGGRVLEEVRTDIQSDHYLHLLQGNYIGMHATVMYRRWVFDHFQYDISLKACEDYDLYLRIARQFPVVHHSQLIACYLIHGSNMSSDTTMMLHHVLTVLKKQQPMLRSSEERKALKNGIKIWKEYYHPQYGSAMKISRKKLKQHLPDFVLRTMYAAGILREYIPKPGHVRKGDFMRVKPFSTQFGYDRGGPVDRYYIENFLRENSGDVRGHVLEIGDNEYTLKYGGEKVSKTDILHIDPKNAKATIIGDLSSASHIADDTFDCVILTQTLHLIYNFHGAIETCFRILKPGGVLLMTVPGITHIDQGEWQANWLWAFTGGSISRILSETFPKKNCRVETFGNVFSATAFLYGMGLKEVRKSDMDFHDPHYQVIITAKAIKPH